MTEGPSSGRFTVVVHGTIEGAECLESNMLYCRSTLVKGREWSVALQGGERANTVDVITQMAERLPGPVPKFTWNAPMEFVLHSANVHGWPQLALSLTNVGNNGKHHVVAYARCHVPMQSGVTTVELPLTQPDFANPQQKLFSKIDGTKAEFKDFAFLCSTDDRLVLTMKRVPGFVRVTFHTTITGMAALGYN